MGRPLHSRSFHGGSSSVLRASKWTPEELDALISEQEKKRYSHENPLLREGLPDFDVIEAKVGLI